MKSAQEYFDSTPMGFIERANAKMELPTWWRSEDVVKFAKKYANAKRNVKRRKRKTK